MCVCVCVCLCVCEYTLPGLWVYLEIVDKRESATLIFYYKTGQAVSFISSVSGEKHTHNHTRNTQMTQRQFEG